MIRERPHKRGIRCVEVVCDTCDRFEIVSDGQVNQKVQKLGWTFIKGKHYCAACEAKRKVSNHQKELEMATKAVAPIAEGVRQPTPKQKREIIGVLEVVYDDDAKRYKDGESDKTVAEAIGDGVLWGWVAQVREELFGPDTRNQEIEEIRKSVTRLEGEIGLVKGEAKKAIDNLESKLAGIRRKLEKVA